MQTIRYDSDDIPVSSNIDRLLQSAQSRETKADIRKLYSYTQRPERFATHTFCTFLENFEVTTLPLPLTQYQQRLQGLLLFDLSTPLPSIVNGIKSKSVMEVFSGRAPGFLLSVGDSTLCVRKRDRRMYSLIRATGEERK